jgi:hypothetical protein
MTAAPAVATAVPNSARFWAIYMSQMHGTCSASTLATMTGLDASAAQSCLSSLIRDGVITPKRIMSRVVGSQANKPHQPSKWRERIQKFMDDKRSVAQPQSAEPETVEIPNEVTDQDTQS